MKQSESMKDRLKREEGFRAAPYKCPAGHLTIGYGHNMDASPLPPDMERHLEAGGRITREMAEELLDRDIGRARIAAGAAFPGLDTLDEVRRSVLIDMAFNMGEGVLKKFVRLRAAIAGKDFAGAAGEMERSAWYKQVGRRAERLARMMREGR